MKKHYSKIKILFIILSVFATTSSLKNLSFAYQLNNENDSNNSYDESIS